MNNKSNIQFFLHFGVGRTGTTFLQDEIIKKLKGFKIVINKDDKIRLLLTKIIDDKFNNNSDIVELQNLFKDCGYKKIIISDETLCYKLLNLEDLKELSRFFYKCNILITIRSQIKALESIYIERINHKRYFLSFDHYLENILNNIYIDDYDKVFFQSLNYERLYFLLKSLSKNIYFLPFEYLSSNKSQYQNILNDFFENKLNYKKVNYSNKINRRKSRKWLVYEKFRSKLPLKRNLISKYFYKKIKSKINIFFWEGKPAKVKVSDNNKRKIMEFFDKNNKKIEIISKINLKKLNYFFK